MLQGEGRWGEKKVDVWELGFLLLGGAVVVQKIVYEKFLCSEEDVV